MKITQVLGCSFLILKLVHSSLNLADLPQHTIRPLNPAGFNLQSSPAVFLFTGFLLFLYPIYWNSLMLVYKPKIVPYTWRHLSNPALCHIPFAPIAQLDLNDYPSRYNKGMHQESTLSWHPGGGINLCWFSKWAVFTTRLKTCKISAESTNSVQN